MGLISRVWSIKTDQHGCVIRFKARLVALGNLQRPSIEFAETAWHVCQALG